MTLIVAVAGSAALAGCGSNTDALTQQWYDPTDGANDTEEESLDGMAARDVVVVSNGSDATVVGTFVNTGDETDEVVAISVTGEDADITGDLSVDPAESVRLGPPGEARAQIDGLDLEPGTYTEVEISYGAAPRSALTAVVRAAEGQFEASGPE